MLATTDTPTVEEAPTYTVIKNALYAIIKSAAETYTSAQNSSQE